MFGLSPKQTPYLLIILWLAVVMSVSYALTPTPPTPNTSRKAKNTSWLVPHTRDNAKVDNALKTVENREVFYKKPPPAPKTPPKPKKTPAPPKKTTPKKPPKKRIPWTLRGFVQFDDTPYALIKVEKKSLRLKVGEKLPNGEIIKIILPDRILFSEDGKDSEQKLYKTPPPSPERGNPKPKGQSPPPPKKK